MYQFFLYILLLLMCHRIYGINVIHYLNDTEYEKMPNLFELENYDSCLEHPGAVYCVASMELYGDSNNTIYNTMQEYSAQVYKHFNYSTIDRGVCVTKTCQRYIEKSKLETNEDLERILEACLSDTMKERYGLTAKISRLNCDKPEEEVVIDVLDYAVAILFVILIICVISGSYYDKRCKSRNNEEICTGNNLSSALLCFSVFRNTDKLSQKPDVDERLLELRGLYGVRTLSQILIVFGHSLFTFTAFVSDPHTFEKAYDSKFRIIFSSTSLVQLYFFISGFIMTYYLQIHSEKQKVYWRNIPLILLNRWWRLTAPMAIVIAFIATWLRHIGSGPLWKYFVTNGVTAQCRDYYWAHLLYFNNFLSNDRFCLLQTWHLAVDIQLFIMGLAVYFMLRNQSWRMKCGVMFLILSIGVINPVITIVWQNIAGVAMYTPEALRTLTDRNFHKYHVLVHNNMPPFFLGMCSAYIGYYLKQNKVDLRHSKLGNMLCWLSVPLLVVLFNVLGLCMDDPRLPSPWLTVVMAATHRFVIGLVAGVWTLGVVMKFNGLSQALLEWRGLEILGKLSYGVFLLNIDVYNFVIASRTRLIPISFLNLFFLFIGVVFLCYLLSYVLYLLVEAPACQLFKMVFEKHQLKKKTTKTQ